MSFTISRNWSGKPVSWLKWPGVSSAWVREATPLVTAAVREAAPVYHGFSQRTPGKLRDSIIGVPTVTPNTATIEIIAGVKYADYVIHGAARHVISARKASRLAWRGPDGMNYAQSVNHPGQRPNDFVTRAITPLQPVLYDLFADIVKRGFIFKRK